MTEIEFDSDAYWGGHRRGDDCPLTAVIFPEEARPETYAYSDLVWKSFRPSLRRGIYAMAYPVGIFDARKLQVGTILGITTEVKNLGEINGPDSLRYVQYRDYGIVSPGSQEGQQNQRLILYTPTDNPRKTMRSVGETEIQVGVVKHTRGIVAGIEVDTLRRVKVVSPIGIAIGGPPEPPPGAGGRRRVFDMKNLFPRWRPNTGFAS